MLEFRPDLKQPIRPVKDYYAIQSVDNGTVIVCDPFTVTTLKMPSYEYNRDFPTGYTVTVINQDLPCKIIVPEDLICFVPNGNTLEEPGTEATIIKIDAFRWVLLINNKKGGGGGDDYVLPTASKTIKGGIKVGKNLTINLDSSLDAPDPYVLPTASKTTLGAVKIGENLTIDENGQLNAEKVEHYELKPATDKTLGGITVGDNLTIDKDGKLSAQNSYELPISSPDTLGGIKVGKNLTINKDGVLDAEAGSSYTLPIATSDKLGGIKIGKNLNIHDDGTLDGPDEIDLSKLIPVLNFDPADTFVPVTQKDKVNKTTIDNIFKSKQKTTCNTIYYSPSSNMDLTDGQYAPLIWDKLYLDEISGLSLDPNKNYIVNNNDFDLDLIITFHASFDCLASGEKFLVAWVYNQNEQMVYYCGDSTFVPHEDINKVDFVQFTSPIRIPAKGTLRTFALSESLEKGKNERLLGGEFSTNVPKTYLNIKQYQNYGVDGKKGDKGDKGDQGEKGDPGTAFLFKFSWDGPKKWSDLPDDGFFPKNWDGNDNPQEDTQLLPGQAVIYVGNTLDYYGETYIYKGLDDPDHWEDLGSVCGPTGPEPDVNMSGDQITVDGKIVGPHLTGPRGLQGPKGDTGASGKDGVSPSVNMSGDQITVDGKIVGPHLTGPQGPAGSKGDSGGWVVNYPLYDYGYGSLKVDFDSNVFPSIKNFVMKKTLTYQGNPVYPSKNIYISVARVTDSFYYNKDTLIFTYFLTTTKIKDKNFNEVEVPADCIGYTRVMTGSYSDKTKLRVDNEWFGFTFDATNILANPDILLKGTTLIKVSPAKEATETGQIINFNFWKEDEGQTVWHKDNLAGCSQLTVADLTLFSYDYRLYKGYGNGTLLYNLYMPYNMFSQPNWKKTIIFRDTGFESIRSAYKIVINIYTSNDVLNSGYTALKSTTFEMSTAIIDKCITIQSADNNIFVY